MGIPAIVNQAVRHLRGSISPTVAASFEWSRFPVMADTAAGMGGSSQLRAAVAIKEMIAAGTPKGTIRFLATPAEESIGGKIFMIRDGVFKDVDAVLVWHPADETKADNDGIQASVQFFVEFKG